MNSLLRFLLLVLAAVIAIDLSVGVFADYYLAHHRLPGDYESIDHLMRDSHEDMVIMGSSLALNDINPNIIADSLGISCYNGGANAQLFPFFETMLEGMLHHGHRPSCILLALRPDELGGSGIGNRFNILTPYYQKGYVTLDKYMESAQPAERYLLKSNLYRYNTIWWRILLYHIITPGVSGQNGFTGKPMPLIFPTLMEVETTPITEERKHSFESFMQTCHSHSIRVWVVFPPVLYKKTGEEPTISYVSDYCQRHDIPCHDDSQAPHFLSASQYFYDNTHLNIQGSEEYTKRIIPLLRQALERAQ